MLLDDPRSATLFSSLQSFAVADRAETRASKKFLAAREASNAELGVRGWFECDVMDSGALLFVPGGEQWIDAGIPIEQLPADHFAHEVAARHSLVRRSRRLVEAMATRQRFLDTLERHKGAANPRLLLRRAKTLAKKLEAGPARDRIAAALPGIRAFARAEAYG